MTEAIRSAALLLAAGTLACATSASPRPSPWPTDRSDAQPYANQYLSDPKTPEPFKDAIRRGVVVEGMCPLQAFAAAGPPGPYMVRKDQGRWGSDVPPPVVIDAQCSAPDESVIELMFSNKTQFSSQEDQVFRVRFVRGKAVLIDQKGFTE